MKYDNFQVPEEVPWKRAYLVIVQQVFVDYLPSLPLDAKKTSSKITKTVLASVELIRGQRETSQFEKINYYI